jgi:hypothetical protein
MIQNAAEPFFSTIAFTNISLAGAKWDGFEKSEDPCVTDTHKLPGPTKPSKEPRPPGSGSGGLLD